MKTPPPNSQFNRRDFLRGGSFGTLMTMLGGVELLARADAAPAPAAAAGARVKVALIGGGTWGFQILTALAKQPLAEVAVVCDTYPAILRKCEREMPGVRVEQDYTAVLADKAIQAIIIATPTHLHRDITVAALKAGKHVYCEVPLAHTVEDAKAIALAAKDAPMQIFQSGLQLRSDPTRLLVQPFIRSGSPGPPVMLRAQWHKKEDWRRTSPNPDRQTALNWRLDSKISTGLMGEIGIHQLDQCCWLLIERPKAITGFHSFPWLGNRDNVPGTIQAIFEYQGATLGPPGGTHLDLDITIANSHGGRFETYYGMFSTILMRENRAWMFKEASADLYGFEVYCRREKIFDETGIVLGPDEEHAPGFHEPKEPVDPSKVALCAALKNFVTNVRLNEDAIRAFVETYGPDEPDALTEHIKKHVPSKLLPAASALDGFQATVMAIKSNEAILSRQRMEFKDEWFQLS